MDPQIREVTQLDIARALGISKATVSLALRDKPEVPVARRREVHEAAARMGYQPNPAATELAHRKFNSTVKCVQASIAWINAWQPAEGLRAFRQFDCYWLGAHEAAKKLGYNLEEFRLDRKITAMRLHRILESRGIRGILLPPHGAKAADWQDFPWENYSVVRFGRALKSPLCHVTSADQVANAMLAFEKIRSKGYRRIGFLTNEEEKARQAGHLSEAGFLMAQRLVDESERVPICAITGVPNSGRAARVADWVRAHRVDAILTDDVAAVTVLKKSGLRVPQDVGFAAVNIHDQTIPAGVNQKPLEIGRVGLLMVHSLINDNARGIPSIFRQILVEGSWVDGSSLPDRLDTARANPDKSCDARPSRHVASAPA